MLSSFSADQRHSSLDQSRSIVLGLEKWQECFGKRDVAQVICREFRLDGRDIDGLRLRKVCSTLYARVQQDAVQIWVSFGDAF